MAVPLPKLRAPGSRLIVDRSHFLHESSRHDELIKSHPFNYQVDICIPDADVSVLEDTRFSKYYEGFIHVSSLIHPAFIEAFIKRGSFQLTSCSEHIDTDDVVSLSPNGHLYLHLTKNTYHSLGLVGKASIFYKRSHDKKYVVDIDLTDCSFRPSTKSYQRAKTCLSRLTQLFRVVFSWHPHDEAISPSSPSLYFLSAGYKCREMEPSTHSFSTDAVRCCPLAPDNRPPGFTSPTHSTQSADLNEVWEWLGAVICGMSAAPGQDDSEDYLSSYNSCCCSGSDCHPLSHIYRLTARGMITASDLTPLLHKLRLIAVDRGWTSLTVHGFSDACVSYGGKEHGYLADGDNLYTFIVFPDGSYWLYMAHGSFHETN